MKVTPNRIIQTGRRPQRVQIAGAFAAVLVMTAGLVATAPDVSAGAVFTVTTTADSGAGSLRDAIIAANADATATPAAPHQIGFAIPGSGVQTINVLSALPAITRPTVIDGLSQPGATCGDSGAPRQLLVAIRGRGNALAMPGLVLTGGASTVQGLAVSFFRAGDVITTGAAGGDTIRCNHIGTNAAGTLTDSVTSNGGSLTGNPVTTAALDVSSPGTVVGGRSHTAGTCDGDCNVIAGESDNNNQLSILLRFGSLTSTGFNGLTSTSSAAGGTMQGNFIGIAQNGQNFPTTKKAGYHILMVSSDSASAAAPAVPQPIPSSGDYLIGGLDAGGDRDPLAGNVISGAKHRDGIDCNTATGCASGVRIHGNLIGVGPTGAEATDLAGITYGNARDGIQLEGQHSADIVANVVSGNGSNGINAGSLTNDTNIADNTVGLTTNGLADGNGWYSTARVAASPDFGLGAVSTNTNAGSGNGISIGAYGCGIPNRDCTTLTVSGNVVGNNARAGVIALNGTGNMSLTDNFIGTDRSGTPAPNGAAGVVVMTAGNRITGNVIAANGGPGVTVLRNTNALLGSVVGAYTPVPATATDNVISRNSIFDNVGLGIDLASVSATWNGSGNQLLFPYTWTRGVTPNDGLLSAAPPTNAATFGNRDVDYPVITSAVVSASANTVTVGGHVGMAGGSAVFGGSTVEVFAGDDTPADQSGEIEAGDALAVAHPEGRTFIGDCPTTAGGTFSGCVLSLPPSLPASSWASGGRLTSTATLASATSEFGPQLDPVVLGAISGTVFLDDTGAPIEGVPLTLLDHNGAVVAVTTTAADGTYSFADLPAGDYTVVETQPAGHLDGVVTPGNQLAITVIAGSVASGNDFSEALPPPPTTTTTSTTTEPPTTTTAPPTATTTTTATPSTSTSTTEPSATAPGSRPSGGTPSAVGAGNASPLAFTGGSGWLSGLVALASIAVGAVTLNVYRRRRRGA